MKYKIVERGEVTGTINFESGNVEYTGTDSRVVDAIRAVSDIGDFRSVESAISSDVGTMERTVDMQAQDRADWFIQVVGSIPFVRVVRTSALEA